MKGLLDDMEQYAQEVRRLQDATMMQRFLLAARRPQNWGRWQYECIDPSDAGQWLHGRYLQKLYALQTRLGNPPWWQRLVLYCVQKEDYEVSRLKLGSIGAAEHASPTVVRVVLRFYFCMANAINDPEAWTPQTLVDHLDELFATHTSLFF